MIKWNDKKKGFLSLTIKLKFEINRGCVIGESFAS